MKMLLFIGIVSIIAPFSMAENSLPIEVSGHPQLFLDDHLIARMSNLQRQVQQPLKHPANPLIVQDLPWEKRMIETYGTVLYDAQLEKFRCWYTASEHKDGIPDVPEGEITAEYFICYAESKDGIHWTKPLVGQEKFGLHDNHNIVIHGGHGFCVLATPDDPDPARRYKGAGGPIFGFSPDGIRWDTRNWLDAVKKNDTSTSFVRWQGEYLAYVRYQVKDPQWPGVMRGIGLCVSKDFESWTPKQLIFTTDKKDGYPWTQPYGLAVTSYGDQLIGILWLLHLDPAENNNSLGDEDTQLVVSRDGRTWKRVANRGVFIESTPGSWDEGKIHAPTTTMFVKDDLIYIYYSGSNTRHGSGSWGTTGIGLATLPADRFVALKPKNLSKPGILQTVPLKFTGDHLLLNAELSSTDDLKAELLDKDGHVIPGFEKENTIVTKSDELRYEVHWWIDKLKGKTLIMNNVAQPAAIRFNLTKGSLYAFQIVK